MSSEKDNPRPAPRGYNLPAFFKAKGGGSDRYNFLWRWVVIVTSLVAITPLFILTFMNYFQYENAIRHEVRERVDHMTSSTKRSLEFFLSERMAALQFVALDKSYEELSDQDEMVDIFQNLQDVLGDMVDLGFIDQNGAQISYVGTYDLLGRDYSDQDWFHEVRVRGYYISDVFLGYRKFPHFVIAVAKKGDNGKSYVLRATIDSDILARQLRSLNLSPPSEAFIINREGVLQTPSLNYGGLLEKSRLPVPAYSEDWVVREKTNPDGGEAMMGHAYIGQSPFILIVVKQSLTAMENWFSLRRNLWLVLIISSLVILLIIVLVSYYMVSRIKEADAERARVLHRVEYQNKMASLGRLAAGVAHEINNPLAIIGEKAGMIKDITALTEDFPRKDKTESLADSILRSVERCSRITRRLLGFAKHIDVQVEEIDLSRLVRDVITFLEHEARYRNVFVELDQPDEDLPPIHSDRGQLEQVFLNLVNNSLNALGESGEAEPRIRISVAREDSDHLSAAVEDNGPGIGEENLKHVFEPFFTTRREGTGLGLSITYGIVDKLGGKIEVRSKLGVGTSFKVILPLQGP